MLNEQVLLLSKKHGQLKQATTKMVQVVMSFLDSAPSTETKLSVIETLRTVTEGKVSYTLAMVSTWGPGSNNRAIRYSSKLNELGSLEFYPISKNRRATSMRRQTYYASFKSRRSDQWRGGKRPNSF